MEFQSKEIGTCISFGIWKERQPVEGGTIWMCFGEGQWVQQNVTLLMMDERKHDNKKQSNVIHQ